MRIGLVEDNEDFRAEVAFHLGRAGFEIVLQSDGRDIDARLVEQPCDLLLLDLGLPVEDGLSIARRLRETHSALRIVMLTARGTIDARVDGLNLGADAYLSKPVDMRELVAVLNSVARRLPEPTSTFDQESWWLDRHAMTLESSTGRRAVLTAREVAILELLASSGGEPASRDQIAAVMVQTHLDSDARRIEVAMSRLRHKIGLNSAGLELIRSVRNHGYQFTARLRVRS